MGGLLGTPVPSANAAAPAGALAQAAAGLRAVKQISAVPARFATPQAKPKAYTPTKTTFPQAAAATVALTPPAAGSARGARSRAAGTPVSAQSIAPSRGSAYAGPKSLRVKVLDHSAAVAAGIPGILMTVSADKAGAARVAVDYSDFAQAYGGNYAGSLALSRYPSCILTTPQVPACQKATPLPSVNDMDTQTVEATVTVPTAPVSAPASATGFRTAALSVPAKAPSTGSTMVLAAAATSTGPQGGAPGGTYNATSLDPSGSWTGGGSSGSFNYSYPLASASAPSDLVPAMGLSYSSASTDGKTAATQSQASWAGEGWGTPNSFIEQSFQSCAESPEGTAAPTKIYDRCYDGPIYTLSLNGSTSALVWDATKKVFKTETAEGATIVHYCTLPTGKTTFSDPTCTAGTNNGSATYFNDWWKVTNRDGTTYSFGTNRLPGWASGKAATNSVAYQPVYSSHAGDPCYNATFSAAVCTMPYRWGLDYVVDTHANAMSYYYKLDTNYYGAYNGASMKPYVRDQYLDHIDYGFTDGNAYGTVANKYVFTTGARCVSGTCTPLSATTAPNWPDVPYTQICASGATCKSYAPTFFSTVRLASITSQQYSTATSTYTALDTYTLTQSIPQTGDGTAATLWLDKIVHTASALGAGTSTTKAITMPPVTFGATAPMANRLDTQSDGLPAYFKYRLGTITTETGSRITVAYGRPNQCSASAKPTPATNTSSCYPVSWVPDGYTAPITDWFNKYAVTKVSQDDPTGGAPAQVTSYDYNGGAAWHFDDNELVKAKYRTYGQFRGYGDVTTYTGDGVTNPKAKSQTTYYRGMSKNNNTTIVNVTDSLGGTHEDVDQLAGQVLESSAYLGANVDHSTITSYWVSAAAATRSRTGLPALTSTWVAPVQTFTRQAVTSTGTTTWRYTATDTSYVASPTDANFGLPVRVFNHTSPIDPAYSTCSSTTYAAPNSAKNLVGLAAEVETVSVACGGYTAGAAPSVPGSLNTLTAPATVSRPAQVVAATRSYYDDTTFAVTFPQATAPSKGDVTMVRAAADYTGGAYVWQTTSRAKFDSVGRQTDAYDGNGSNTHTAYTSNTVGLTTGATVTNGLGQTSATATLDTQRGITVKSSDINGVTTTSQYDALGRISAVWLSSRATTAAANYLFTYVLSNAGPTAVTTQELNDSLGYKTSTLIYDGLLRPRQTQRTTPRDGRLVSDTFYDTRGWVSAKYTNWWDDSTTPNTATISAVDLQRQVPMQNVYTYNSLGQVVIDRNQNNGTEVSRTTTVYNGDLTTVIPPAGATVTTTVVDPIGRKTRQDDYLTRPTLNSPADPFTGTYTVSGGTAQTVSYGYDSHGNQNTTVQGAPGSSGPTWIDTFNLLGQVTAKSDPDAGTTTNIKYDGAGNLKQATDARGKTISYSYDALGRRTGVFASAADAQQPANTSTGTTGNQLAAWVYDNANNVAGVTNALGQLTTTTSYTGGNAYTAQQTGFNIFGKPLGTAVTIPTAEGALAGTYTVKHLYTANAGLLLKDIYLAQGGLPAEQVLHTYRSHMDLPDGLAGLAGYTQSTSYDAYSRVLQTSFGPSTTAFTTVGNTYDPNSGLLTNKLTSRTANGVTTTLDEQAYRHDDAGNLLAQASIRQGNASTAETQCFDYDGLDQLVGAWTANDTCRTTPTAGNTTMVADGLGPASAYWTTWTFDTLGDRTGQTQHAFTAGPATDTVTTYTYGKAGSQPHTLTATATTGATTTSTGYGYDTAGNMTSRNAGQGNQILAYNDLGKVNTVSGSTDGNSTFLYDAGGDLLIQKDPGSVTLYLGNQQFTLNTSTSAVTGTRYYTLPGGGQAIRTGTTATAFRYVIGDSHGTPSLYLDNSAANPTWRQYTPYGDTRGSAVTAPDNRGFLNKPLSKATGLTVVGARQYDPVIGRFITLDPILEKEDPTQLNGYGYAGNNPAVHADPTGLRIDPDGKASDTGYSGDANAARKRSNDAAKNNGTGATGCNWSCLSKKPAPHNGVPLTALRNHGYNGTDAFTYKEAAEWASGSEDGFMMVCLHTLNKSDGYCNDNNPWTKPRPLTAKEGIAVVLAPLVILGVVGLAAGCVEALFLCAIVGGNVGRGVGSSILSGASGDEAAAGQLSGSILSKAQQADQAMRAGRTRVKLSDLRGVQLPDYGDAAKVSQVRGMSDEQLINSINNPDELGGVVVLDGRTVINGNHRIAEALRRMNDPFFKGITPDTEVLVLQ